MAEEQAPETLDGRTATTLIDLARACRSAARAVNLYPAEHPAIQASLGRLAEMCERAVAGGPWLLTVTPGQLLLDGRALPRPDSGVREFADLLHDHHIGQLAIQPGGDAALWLKFMRLLATPTEDLQRQGGIARVWATTGGQPIAIQELDYAAVLRSGLGADAASWDDIVRNCLRGTSIDLDEETLRVLSEVAGDPDRLVQLVQRLEEEAKGGSLRSPASALMTILQSVVRMITRSQPERLEPTLTNMAVAAARFSPDVMLDMLASRGEGAADGSIDVADEIVNRLNDKRIAGFVANSVMVSRGATARLAEAFMALVPEPARRNQLLGLAREEVAGAGMAIASAFGGGEAAAAGADFDQLWQGVQNMLESYSDEAFVSKDYARDLDHARARATEIDAITDDPPERIAGWLASVSDGMVRSLDLQLLLDLLKHEADGVRWREMSELVVSHVDDLLLIGDFNAAAQLVSGLSAATIDDAETARQTAALVAIDRLINSQALVHIVYHLQSADEEDFQHAKSLCQSLGPGVIKPLAELLAVQERARARQRLTDILLAFGALGRQSAEQLKLSANPSVRRVAVHLLREFGGTEALPDLESLLDDAEPHVQREAVRAILLIGTDDAYSVLERALGSASARSRETILEQLDMAGDERAAPLFSYIVRRGDYRKSLRGIYVKAVSALGRLGGDEAIDVLKLALHRGEWYAPLRTAELRTAAARSLRQIAGDRAMGVLQEAADRGPRKVRMIARAALASKPAAARRPGRTRDASTSMDGAGDVQSRPGAAEERR